jgi:hypothetical protein
MKRFHRPVAWCYLDRFISFPGPKMTQGFQLHWAAIVISTTLFLAHESLPASELSVRVKNPGTAPRPRQTVELSARQLAPLGEPNLSRLHVMDASGRVLLCQAVDTDGDSLRIPDQLVFQADFGPGEERAFTVSVGEPHRYTAEHFKVYGRFVRERFDDFAWENDRIAHRTYGKALETWQGEPLSSSTIDVWCKRTPRLVLNDWYMTDDYHADHGEGADLYSAGLSRGCGGNGLWARDRLWVSRNFVESRVLANGPIRLVFELVYEPFEMDGISVSEIKRVTLDAGQQLNHFDSYYQPYTRPGRERTLVSGVGLKKVEGEQVVLNPEQGWLAKWEPVAKEGGEQGLAIVFGPGDFVAKVEDELNHLVVLTTGPDGVASYWAGFCWDKAGALTGFDPWKAYLTGFSETLAMPLMIEVEERP